VNLFSFPRERIGKNLSGSCSPTNYYLQGFPTIDLLKITGHTTEKVFLNYIKVTKLDPAKRPSKHIKMWSEKTSKATETLLKAVKFYQ
jgi:hypothetical protein